MSALLSLLPAVALAVALAITLTALRRARREHRRTVDDLPTGLCAIAKDERILLWNGQMEALSGVSAKDTLSASLKSLPAPWPDALRDALADGQGHVIKRALGADSSGDTRWIVLHGSAERLPGERRLVLVEEITDYQRLQDTLLHKERLASIGRVAAGVAHEIGNPVTGIACIAQNLADSADPAELEQGTAEILKQTERISRIVGSLMQLSHPGSVSREPENLPCNLADCVDEAIHLLQLDRDRPEGLFDNRCNRELLVSGDNQLLLQMFLNLLDNARSAAAGEGSIIIDAKREDDQVSVTIDNPGDVISEDLIEKIFEPFFTTKDVGEGTGLGLPLVRGAAESMGGSISLISPSPGQNGRGTRAQLTLDSATYPPEFVTEQR